MLRFIVRRLLQTIPTIASVALLIFILFSVIPGSFASSLFEDGRGVDPAIIERMQKELGLSDPVHVRFGRYVKQLATFDLGTSFRTREPVTQLIGKRMWPTLQLAFASMIFAIVVGIPLYIALAQRWTAA